MKVVLHILLTLFFTNTVMAQINYDGPLVVYVKSFNTYLEKGKVDSKYFKSCEGKINYVKKRDPELAARMQSALDEARGSSNANATSTTPSDLNQGSRNTRSTSNTSDAVLQKTIDKNCRMFEDYLAKCKINAAECQRYYDRAKDKAIYVKSKDTQKGSAMLSRLEAVSNKWEKQAVGAADLKKRVYEMDQAFKYLDTNIPKGGYDSDNPDGAAERTEASVQLFKAKTDFILQNYSDLLEIAYTKIQSVDVGGRRGASMQFGDFTYSTYLLQFYNQTKSILGDSDNDFRNIESGLKDGGNSPEISYNQLISRIGFYESVSKLFPFEKGFKVAYNKYKTLEANSGGRSKARATMAASERKELEDRRMPKAVRQDPVLEAKVKEYFMYKKPEHWGAPLRITLNFANWNIHKHPLTGIPLYKRMNASIASKDNKTGKVHIRSIMMRSEYNGSGWEAAQGETLHPLGMEILPENVHK